MTRKLVILHGWASKQERWQAVIREFEGQGFEVFFPVLPGFGPQLPAKFFSLEDYSAWLGDYLEENGLKRVVILGHSFGGQIASKFSLERASSVEALILVAAGGIHHFSLLKIFYKLVAKIGGLIFSLPIIAFFREPSRWLFYTLIGEKDYYRANYWQKQTLKKILKEDLKEKLGKIRIPTLILWGKEDRVTPVDDAYLLNKKIKNSKLVVHPQASHSLPFEEKDWLIEAVVSFLDDLEK